MFRNLKSDQNSSHNGVLDPYTLQIFFLSFSKPRNFCVHSVKSIISLSLRLINFSPIAQTQKTNCSAYCPVLCDPRKWEGFVVIFLLVH